MDSTLLIKVVLTMYYSMKLIMISFSLTYITVYIISTINFKNVKYFYLATNVHNKSSSIKLKVFKYMQHVFDNVYIHKDIDSFSSYFISTVFSLGHRSYNT